MCIYIITWFERIKALRFQGCTDIRIIARHSQTLSTAQRPRFCSYACFKPSHQKSVVGARRTNALFACWEAVYAAYIPRSPTPYLRTTTFRSVPQQQTPRLLETEAADLNPEKGNIPSNTKETSLPPQLPTAVPSSPHPPHASRNPFSSPRPTQPPPPPTLPPPPQYPTTASVSSPS